MPNRPPIFASTLLYIFVLFLFSLNINASEESKEDAPLTLEEYVEGMDVFEGIFTLYQDIETGSLSMEINEDQFNKEFLYFALIENGVSEADTQRGSHLTDDVIEIKKYFDRVDFVKKNTTFYIDEGSTLHNGGYANISDSVLASLYVEAVSEDKNRVLVNVDSLFQTEALVQITYNLDPDTPPHEQFSIGSLDQDKGAYTHIGVYPENMNIRSTYVYTNEKPHVYGSNALADSRASTMNVQHSFVNMPDNDFVPRLDDQRVGYFTKQVTDLSSFDLRPYRDLITRWHLVKKRPEKALSEPVEPIVWWIENTVPHEYREIMKKGVLAWNSAFEKAGFKNALVVNIQPDDATWSGDDIRYNVIRYSNSPDIGWAFGPSYANPRTGQIMGGDVMFEQNFISGYGFDGDLLANPDAFISHLANKSQHKHAHDMNCRKAFQMQQMLSFGRTALKVMDASVSEKRKIIEQMLMELMLHEVGHVLGLMHNMKASNLHSFEDALKPEVTKGITTSSVMDYTALLIAKPGEVQGDFFTTAPGAYDDWAIQFGYDPSIEGKKREQLLARSTERVLMFGNDADDMRTPGAGIDPRTNIWDMTSDSIAFARYQMELVDELLPITKDKLAKDGESFAKIRLALRDLIFYKYRGAQAVSSFIGGVEVNRYLQGQQSDLPPYKAVDLPTQKRAMQTLAEYIFAPDAFNIPGDLIQHAAMQRREFDHYGGTEDPKVLTSIAWVQEDVFERILHPVVLMRLSDSQLYGNEYSVNAVLKDLTNAVFEADIKKQVSPLRQNLQTDFANRLLNLLKDDAYDSISKAAAFNQLKRIEKWVKKGRVKHEATKAHRQYIAYLIKSTLDED